MQFLPTRWTTTLTRVTALSLLAIALAIPTAQAGPAASGTSEATWYRYPALSPDGGWIAFSALGDLWVVAAEGGTARALTRGEQLETRPVWSPDGAWIAYASDRHGNFDVFLIPGAGGAERRLTTHSAGDYPWTFSPDGARLWFSSGRTGLPASRVFPAGYLGDTYSVGLEGGRARLENLQAAEELSLSATGGLLYERVTSMEDDFRKHHTSSAARDIWLRRPDGRQLKVTDFPGDDREPVWRSDGMGFWQLSEQDGCLNVWSRDLAGGATQLSHFKDQPVRGLCASRDGLLCFSQAGALWTLRPGDEPRRLEINLDADRLAAHPRTLLLAGEADEAALSPDGKEIAFIARGEVFVCSAAHGTTRRVTDTPEQERDLSFAPDGRSLAYAAERGGSWNIYLAQLTRPEDLHFYSTARMTEEALLTDDEDTFQPRFSPDGKELAYLAKRTELRVIDLKTRVVRTVLPETINYSYADGDQSFDWSPDGQWFTFHYPEKGRWMDEVGVVPATGGGWHNLTQSGYQDYDPRWSADGRAITYRTGRNGLRSHGAWGFQEDVYAVFPSRAGQEWYRLSEEEWQERQEADSLAQASEDEKAEGKAKGKGGAGKEKKKDRTVEAAEDSVRVVLEPAGAERRTMRLSTSSSDLADYLLSKDGETLYTLARYAKGVDLYETKIRKRETKLLVPLDLEHASFLAGATDEHLFVLGSQGRLIRIKLDEEGTEDVGASPEMTLRRDQEWQYFFDHIWRQVREKFYQPELHGADWTGLRATYQRYLSALDHPRDFAECMSEMLGELNASHTGCFVRNKREDGDATAELGLLFDPAWTEAGLRVVEVLAQGPCDRSGSRIRAGQVLKAVDGRPIAPGEELWPLLNRRAGEPVMLTLTDEKGKDYDESVKALPSGARGGLLYERWVRRNAGEVDSLSGGRLGYVHVASMDEGSFRRLYHEALGKYADKEGLVVDSRFNGGGNLTQDLVTFFGGRRTFRNVVRPGPRVIGEDPWDSWNRPSIVIMNETNYSDAHCFPFAYKDNQEGKLVGMPVAGTGTAVWWEGLMDGETVFGIPEVGLETEQGNLLENNQLEPDIRVDNTPETVVAGRDLQLETAVRELLKDLPKGGK